MEADMEPQLFEGGGYRKLQFLEVIYQTQLGGCFSYLPYLR
jgi:hypothetical protein